MSDEKVKDEKDFQRSAKVLLNLISSHLKLGEYKQAEEAIRIGLCQASDVGRDRTVKLYNSINDGSSTDTGPLSLVPKIRP